VSSSQTKKRAFIATLAILGSRVFGLIREQVFAFFFGAGAMLDAFVVAFRIPNLLRDLFAEGALSQSFVAIFSKKLATEGDEEAFALANKVSGFIVLLMAFLVTLGIIFSPQIVRVFATGFTGEKYELTVTLMRIMFPFIFFVSLAALLMGILNAKNKFFIPQSASTFFNITSIVAGLLFAYWLSPDYITQTFRKLMYQEAVTVSDFLAISNAIAGMALGTVLGGLVQYLIQLPSLFKLGYKPKWDFKLKDDALIKVLKLTGPAIIGGAAVQVNVLVNTEFASFLGNGPVSYLNFAFRFMQFPLGVFGVAIAVASAPALAKMVAQKKTTDFLKTIQGSIQMSLFFSIPSMVGLIFLGQEIISLIYQHGHFSAEDTLQTSLALTAYSFGIASYSLIKIYQPAYLAFHDARTPMRVSIFSILINLGINSLFIFVLKLPFWSLAMGTAVVALVNIFILTVLFRKKMPMIWSDDLVINMMKIVVASTVMGAALYFGLPILSEMFPSISLFNKLLLVFIPLTGAVILYLLLGLIMQIPDARFFLNKLLRR